MNIINKQQCSLRRFLEIVPANKSAWHALAEYHYRSNKLGPIEKIFAIRFKDRPDIPAAAGWLHHLCLENKPARDGSRPVGVIVYGMPVPNIALRNRATNNRYVGLADKAAAMRLLNREIRCIQRVVIHPQYRGIGLGSWLVGQTLPMAGTRFVEALAVMGRVNPFFVKAGMKQYDAQPGPAAIRMIEAFRHINIEQSQLVEPRLLLKAIEKLETGRRQFITVEMRRFAQRYNNTAGKNRGLPKQKEKVDSSLIKMYAETVVDHVLSYPVYFLWQR